MTDDRRTPPKGIPRVPRASARDEHDRDRYVSKHPDRDFEWEEATGQAKGAELDAIRGRRPTDLRIAHVEKRIDRIENKVEDVDNSLGELHVSVVRKFGEVNAALAGVKQSLDMQAQFGQALIDELREERKAKRDEQHMVVRQTLDIGNKEATARIDTLTFGVRARWGVVGKVVAALTSTAVISAVITAIASGRCG